MTDEDISEENKNWYLYGVIATAEYVDKDLRRRIFAKFNLTASKRRELQKWMHSLLFPVRK